MNYFKTKSSTLNPVGYLWLFNKENNTTQYQASDEIITKQVSDSKKIMSISNLTLKEVERRKNNKNDFFTALIDKKTAGYGWRCRFKTTFGPFKKKITLPKGNEYMWDFFTSPEFRGRGVYPSLISIIINQQSNAEKFWVITQTSNTSSNRGLEKAGFSIYSKVYFDSDNKVYLESSSSEESLVIFHASRKQ